MEDFNLYKSHGAHYVLPTLENIDEHFSSMKENRCQLMICLMESTDNVDDLTQLRIKIKICGTMKYGNYLM